MQALRGAPFRSTSFQNSETELLFIVSVKLVQATPPGSPTVPDPSKLLEVTEAEKSEFTLVPGIPGVGAEADRALAWARHVGLLPQGRPRGDHGRHQPGRLLRRGRPWAGAAHGPGHATIRRGHVPEPPTPLLCP